jgi:hypothetical protein
LPSRDAVHYESTVAVESAATPGVIYGVRRISFGRRCELARRVRELLKQKEFHDAGTAEQDKLEGALLGLEVDRLYLHWGLAYITGLTIDGEPATADAIFYSGPEALCREMVQAVRVQCGLTDDERKN